MCLRQGGVLYGYGDRGKSIFQRPCWTPGCDAFQSGKTLNELISDSYGHAQKTRETEDTLTDDLQIIARNPSFHLEANEQLKAQYAHKLRDFYYTTMAHSALQSSPEEETLARFGGCLVAILEGLTK